MTTLAEVQRLVRDFLSDYPVATTPDVDLRGARFDAGLAFVSFAEGFGGLGLDPSYQGLVERMFIEAGAVDWTQGNMISLGLAAPTIYAAGTAEQKSRFLRPLFTGEEIWCQLFSEPGAGSDLASLATRAAPVQGGYLVNGQKVWTSLAHVARRGLLLARTDPDVPKHKGLSYFVLDMHLPGVEVRPLRQLTGQAEFNEVYLTDVLVPEADRVGSLGDGWQIAITTLANERTAIGRRNSQRGEGSISIAVREFADAAAAGRATSEYRDRLLRLWTEAEAARLTNMRATVQQGSAAPGPQGSIAKLRYAELNQAIYQLCVDLRGIDGMLVSDYTLARPDRSSGGTADVRKAFLRSLANTIEGGTSDVMRNILGERVLGLPREPRTDGDVAWNQLRRS
ncbi:MAG TPA: acyl-CoA dehydrogenase family protein [Jatrophihabitantaceae bacterium]|jgi:alkylation response protein AidB-like acyl-CoA dehydrogenase|nr:acyl-CoA dehydrogenase family protein [Jatrophihabitantaceae bacterium]